MTIEKAIRTLDDVIPPHTHHIVDEDHIMIALAWESVKAHISKDEASPLTAEHMITFEGKPIDPAKPLYVVCGRFSKKNKEGFPLQRTDQSICFPFIKAYRGYITAIHFDPDNPGIAIRLDLLFNAMDSSEGHLIAGKEYFVGITAQEARKAYQKSMEGKK